ncbi:hypothetical protein MHA02_36910 [Methylobacterium haplocladii]|uniref:Endolytic peptidoglycan transglycosylase RlpA n=4 Tax=Methylobacterium haplocladii TaxID=1176176 RepID=A0A512IUC0_9HYPH|nr:septal ring lytic transglycosylase RlpA family protein [Methylobacterium haplocladii]GEP01304.1 hypothetical protein MHA02_36910 [Methylobacterium haplocladii]
MDARPRVWPVWRLIGVCAVALTAANCAGNNPQRLAGTAASGSEIDPKYGVKASRRLYNEGDVIPKGGGRRFSGKPYVVAGKTYVPRDDAKGYVREGLASWYGSAFHGRMTANGEVFDRHSIAAAHPTLPLPSYARVTNLSNGYSMVVRVNDRGPYHANRVMDLSEEAARALAFHNKGTERVRVEYVGKASVAGSDDRRLLASLRTDGRPASTGSGSPVMVADLGPDREEPAPERFARTARPTLAYKPAGSEEDASEAAPVLRPQRAPIVLASAATVAVPAAVQPTAARAGAFRPMPVAGLNPSGPAARSALASAGRNAAPLSLAPPPIRLAAAMRDPAPTTSAGKRTAQSAFGGGAQRMVVASAAKAPVVTGKAVPTHRIAAAMPSNDKLAMARLMASSTAKPVSATKSASGPAGRRSHLAGAY